MSRFPTRALIVVLAVVALLAVGPVVGVLALASPATPSAPSLVTHAAPTHVAAAAPAAQPRAAPSAASSPGASAPGTVFGCPTPSNPPNWKSLTFFNDVEVTFYVPNTPSLDGSAFQTAPCGNTIPTYVHGFWMNVTTNVPMVNAIVQIWGTTWPNATNPQNPISGFDPSLPANFSMYIPPGGARTTATFYFDVYRYFWPGSQVYFNLTIESASATPSTVYSAQDIWDEFNYSGLKDNYTWTFGVASVWGSTDFASDIAVTTSPNVIVPPFFWPNRNQSIVIELTSLTITNGTLQPIPFARLNIEEKADNVSANYAESFGPANSTVMTAVVPANPGASANFSVTAWVPWEGGTIDRIDSPQYSFNWTGNGGWWYPAYGVVGNLQYSTSPNVLNSGTTKTTLPTGTSVNVTIASTIENVTLGPAQVHFQYTDAAGTTGGAITMTPVSPNASFAVIPGLPSGGSITFYVVAKDIFGTPIASGNSTYSESGAPQPGPGGLVLTPGFGLFFFEAVDLSTGQLVPFLNFTLSNTTWSEVRQGTALGFAAPTPLSGPGFLPVTYGVYVITIHAFGETETATVSVSTTTPFGVVFYVASGSVTQNTWVPQTTLTIPAVVGLIGASLAMWPIGNWFRERRRKAEQEQRRITL
ncbi:MAG: hypothetical protein L3K00_07665 [Thermoplasmata archaeon]|nr:hypothetical protein [Thermoplasmata archaeon]